MHAIGRRVGDIFSKLHDRDIFYNDIIVDGFGECHFIVPTEGEAVIIDYGVSVDMSAYPELDDEGVYNFYRTMIEHSFFPVVCTA